MTLHKMLRGSVLILLAIVAGAGVALAQQQFSTQSARNAWVCTLGVPCFCSGQLCRKGDICCTPSQE